MLRRTQKTTRSKKPDWQPWIMCFLRALQQHKRRLESRVEREKKILGQLPELSLRIYELTKERGQVKIDDVIRVTSAARNGQGPPESADQERLSRAAWQGKGRVVFAAMTSLQQTR